MEDDREPLVEKQSAQKDPYEKDTDCLCFVCCDCCGCRNLRERSKNKTCCLCFPLVVSVWIIAAITFFLAAYWSVGIFLLIFNVYVDSYYVAFLFLFTIPIYFACGLFSIHLNAKDKKSRGYLKLAVVLMLVAIFLTYVWCIYYYTVLND